MQHIKSKKIMLAVFITAFIITPLSSISAQEAYDTNTQVDTLTEDELQDKPDEAIKNQDTERRIIPIINFDALYTYSKVMGHSPVHGAIVDFLGSPVIKVSDRHYIIPLYDFSYNRERQVIQEDEGDYLVRESMAHNAYLTNKYSLTDRLVNKLSVFGTWAYYMETKDEDWSDGLYDYKDFGGIVDFEYTLSHPNAPVYRETGIEFEYYQREYPNFDSLLSLATPTAEEVNEKDYNGYKGVLNYIHQNPDSLSVEAEYRPLYKDYTDKLVVGSDGVLESGEEREDWQHTFNLDFRYPLRKRLTIGLDNMIIINDSNQNYYDSRDTITLADDIFTPNYYDYTSFKIEPILSYDLPMPKDKDLTVQFSYAYLNRQYDDRVAQDGNGAYTGSDQEDEFHTFNLGLSYPLTDKIKAIGIFDYTIADSNMKYEKYYRYNYDLMTVAAGISCRF